MTNNSQTYWAAKSGLDLADEAFRRVERFYTDLLTSVMYERWTKAYRVYYGLPGVGDPWDVSAASSTGTQGELTALKVNHAGNLAQHMVALVSQTVPEFEPIPTNSDYRSLAQVSFTRKLLNYYMDTKAVGEKLFDTALGAAIFGLSWLAIEWDAMAGPPLKVVDPMLPTRTKAGELAFRVFTPLDVVCDRRRYDSEHDWTITRRYVNRWDLAARYPGLADQITSLDAKEFSKLPPTNRLETERGEKKNTSDLIPLYTLYHRKSEALPNGKIAMFLNSDILLYEGNLPYEEVPMVAISPGKMLRTVYGNSPFHHLLALQDVYDNLASAVASNNVALATQFIMMPRTADYSYDDLSAGLAVIEYEPGPEGKLKPEGLNLTAPNGEALRFIDMLKAEMETISGINSTIRGQPPANVTSGAFGALIQQQALTYMGAFQYSFQQAVAKSGNVIVSILKQYADQPIVAEIAGKSHSYQAKEFTRADLDSIHRVTVKSGNPAARTAAFNIAAAQDLLEKGVIKNAKDYLTLVRTGDLDTMIEGEEAELMNVRREDELIREGQNPPVLATDRHRLHIDHHAREIGDPASRANPTVVQAGLAHIQAHIDALRTVDPALLSIMGEAPLDPAPGPQGPPSGTPPPMPGGRSATPPPGLPGTQPGPDPVTPSGPPLPGPPNLPTNPLTGQQWTPQDGAIQS